MNTNGKNENIIWGTLLTLAVLFTPSGCDEANMSGDGEIDVVPEIVQDKSSDGASQPEAEQEQPEPGVVVQLSDAPDVRQLGPGQFVVVWDAKFGTGPIDLGLATERSCFLAGFSGSLNSSNDRARVYTSLGKWYVAGSGGITSVTAHCISHEYVTPVDTADQVWTQNEFYAKTASVAGGQEHIRRICGLTSLRGNFDGTSDEIRLYKSGVAWLFGGKASTPAQGITGTGRCVEVIGANCSSGVPYTWTVGDQPLKLPPSGPAKIGPWFCLLSRVSGNFANNSWISLWSSGADNFLGGGGTAGSAVNTSAVCMNGVVYADFPMPGVTSCSVVP